MQSSLFVRALVVALLGGAACSFVVDSDRQQCGRDADCAGHGLGAAARCVDAVCTVPPPAIDASTEGGAGDPRWACLGHLPPLPNSEPSRPARFRAAFENRAGAPLSGVPFKACKYLDFSCSEPQPGTPTATNASGTIDLLLYSGFRGYLEMPTGAPQDLYPALSLVLPTPDAQYPDAGVAPLATTLFSPSEMEAIATPLGRTLESNTGHVVFVAIDCAGHPAPDTVIRSSIVSAHSQAFYFDEAGAVDPARDRTSASGRGGFLNLPPQPITFALLNAEGQTLSSISVIVRAGATSYAILPPTP